MRNIAMYDVSVTHSSYIVAEAFRCSHLVFASTTYNACMFLNMETVITDLIAHNLQKRTIALIENGSWAPTAGELMSSLLGQIKNTTILGNPLRIKSSVKADNVAQLNALAEEIAASMNIAKPAADAAAPVDEAAVDPQTLFKLSYGLFVVSSRNGERDNGCIINTVMQVTDTPKRIAIAVNKANYTHDMIHASGVFNLSVLSQDAPFGLYQALRLPERARCRQVRRTGRRAARRKRRDLHNRPRQRADQRPRDLRAGSGHSYAVRGRRDRGAHALQRAQRYLVPTTSTTSSPSPNPPIP